MVVSLAMARALEPLQRRNQANAANAILDDIEWLVGSRRNPKSRAVNATVAADRAHSNDVLPSCLAAGENDATRCCRVSTEVITWRRSTIAQKQTDASKGGRPLSVDLDSTRIARLRSAHKSERPLAGFEFLGHVLCDVAEPGPSQNGFREPPSRIDVTTTSQPNPRIDVAQPRPLPPWHHFGF
jgi:hypothetical protein